MNENDVNVDYLTALDLESAPTAYYGVTCGDNRQTRAGCGTSYFWTTPPLRRLRHRQRLDVRTESLWRIGRLVAATSRLLP